MYEISNLRIIRVPSRNSGILTMQPVSACGFLFALPKQNIFRIAFIAFWDSSVGKAKIKPQNPEFLDGRSILFIARGSYFSHKFNSSF